MSLRHRSPQRSRIYKLLAWPMPATVLAHWHSSPSPKSPCFILFLGPGPLPRPSGYLGFSIPLPLRLVLCNHSIGAVSASSFHLVFVDLSECVSAVSSSSWKRPPIMAPGVETVQVAGNDSQDRDALASEGDAQSTLTTQQLRHRQPHAADDEVALPEDGENADASKPKKSHGHHQTTASGDGHGHGFLPGLMKQLGLGGHQEVKENNTPHATDSAHPSDMPSHSGSKGFLPGLMKKVGRHDSHEFKSTDGEHHPPHHHRHGTRDKELFGSEDAEGNYREHKDLFGSSEMDNSRNIEKADSLFGYEDKKFEAGEKGRDLFGDDDPNTLSNRDRMNLVGSSDGDEDETRHVFGEENTEDSDEEGVGSEEHEKDVHHGRSN